MSFTPERWIVVGSAGMLGRDVLAALTAADVPVDQVVGLDLPDLDITSPAGVLQVLAPLLTPATVLINCAAWTAVDDAETAEAAAFTVNAVGPQLLARACATMGARLVQLSTDYVFGGDVDPLTAEPYAVDAPLAPRSAYGRTKAAGEWAVRTELPDHSWIVRTAWLYGEHGPSFPRTMARLLAEREFVDVVDDQHGQPTWTRDLAERLVEMVLDDVPPGVYHGTNAGRTTWHGLAEAVFAGLGAEPARVRRTTSAAFVRPAPRPAFSVLDASGWEKVGLPPMRPWDIALAEFLPTLKPTS